MRVNRTALIGCIMLFLTSLFALRADTQETKTENGAHKQGSERLNIRIQDQHPYMYFTPSRISKFKKRIQNESAVKQVWTDMLDEAEQTVDDDGHNKGKLPLLGLAYRMTGTDKFAAQARDILLKFTERDRWQGGFLLERDPPWTTGLKTQSILRHVAIGYDSVYPFLSDSERKKISEGIIKLGVKPIIDDWVDGTHRIHSLDSMGHNWWSAIVFSAGMGALAVAKDDPRAIDWLRRIRRASTEWASYAGSKLETKPPSFDRDGAFYEGVGYGGFATESYLTFRLAWDNAVTSVAPADIPFMKGIGDFFIHTAYPNDGETMVAAFGDAGLHSDRTYVMSLLWALGHHESRYLWYMNQTSASYQEAMKRTDPIAMLQFPSREQFTTAPEHPGLPPSKLYDDIGWATLRSSWEENETMLAVKSGFTWNHTHADNNSFLLFHDGEYLLIDSGKTGYRSSEYDDYYRQSRAHNVVLFNGQGEPPLSTFRGSQIPGSVQNLMDAGRLKYVWADGTGPMSHVLNRNFRHFLWIGDVILIIDDLRAHEIGQFDWLLHYNGDAERNGMDLNVQKNGVNIAVRPLFPEPFPKTGFEHDFPAKMNLEKRTALDDPDDSKGVPYYAFRPARKHRRTKFINAIILKDDDSPDPVVERFETTEAKGVEIRQNGKVTRVYLNLLADGRRRHLNSNLEVDGWETDAYLLAVTHPEGSDLSDPDAATRWFVGDGSYLRRGDTPIFDSLSNAFATWETTDGQLHVHLQGQPVINAYVRQDDQPSEMLLNGTSYDPAYDQDREMMQIHLDQRE